MGSEKSPMRNQLAMEAGPAIVAAMAGSTNIPEPKTAPMVSAVPSVQVMLFFNSVVFFMASASLSVVGSCIIGKFIVS